MTLRLSLSIILVTVGCAAQSAREPDASTDVVRAAVAPGEALDLTRQTLLHDREYAAARMQVWEVLLAAGEDLGMELASADSASGTVGFYLRTTTPRIAGRHASAWLDCGSGPGGAPRVNTYQLTLRLTTIVEVVAAQQTRVRVALMGYARDRGLIGDQLPCTSTGKLEERAHAAFAARLAPS